MKLSAQVSLTFLSYDLIIKQMLLYVFGLGIYANL